VKHGTRYAYKRGCRCDPCRVAHTEYQWESRMMRYDRPLAPDDPRHGKASTYTNHGCRCRACTAANTAVGTARTQRLRRSGEQGV
jgi:hypothetical protein